MGERLSRVYNFLCGWATLVAHALFFTLMLPVLIVTNFTGHWVVDMRHSHEQEPDHE